MKIRRIHTEEEFETLVAWAQDQEGDYDVTWRPENAVFAVEDDGKIVAGFEIKTIHALSMIFELEGNGRQTLKAMDTIRSAVQALDISPLIPLRRDSPLEEFADHRLLEPDPPVKWYILKG